MSFDELRIFCAETTNVMNERPITYVYDDMNEPRAITPNGLIYSYNKRCFPSPFSSNFIFDKEVYNKSNLIKRFLMVEKITDEIWNSWSNDYLTSLKPNRNLKSKKCSKEIPKKGEVVLIHDDCPRALWKLGIIVDLIKGNDQIVRVAKVKTANVVTTRPINKLFPLELNVEETRMNVENEAKNNPRFMTNENLTEKDVNIVKKYEELKKPTYKSARAAALASREKWRMLQIADDI